MAAEAVLARTAGTPIPRAVIAAAAIRVFGDLNSCAISGCGQNPAGDWRHIVRFGLNDIPLIPNGRARLSRFPASSARGEPFGGGSGGVGCAAQECTAICAAPPRIASAVARVPSSGPAGWPLSEGT